ncbi:4-alpha-glucanotransferase [Streptomyces liliifuscus]|uniref:4-alpha-glucanotransferase n=1 Tax=Streptomyces liliifuscus TaxID=2797636 RepID=A0A7T7KYT9_9ACTN|nr:4-alpha-glucanotransferase [Streptomyces liliifuscus]QQM43296.1 4-alpha-glucanotransferase [Streptomyces liliifuscus]
MPLSRLAALHGVATSFSPSPGRTVAASDAAVVAVLAALGVAAGTPDAVRTALTARETELRERLLPPTLVCWSGAPTVAGSDHDPGARESAPGAHESERARGEGRPAPDADRPAPDEHRPGAGENPLGAGENPSGASDGRPAPDADALAPGGLPSVVEASVVEASVADASAAGGSGGAAGSVLAPGGQDPITPPGFPGDSLLASVLAALPAGTRLRIRTEQGESRASAEQLPLGVHELEATAPDGRTGRAHLVVAPTRLPAAPGRTYGLLVQVYSLLSRRSWGMGDLGDLAELTAWAGRALGAGFVQVNPMHAAVPGAPTDPSPYRPSSRRYPDPVYLRVEDIPEFAYAGERDRDRVRTLLERAERLRESVLDKGALIDRDAVWELKREALELVRDVPLGPGRRAAYCDFLAEEGEALEDHATWCALAEVYGSDWQKWPAALRDPRSAETARARGELMDRVDFHSRLAWLTDAQLATAQRSARDAGMGVGLVHDLAVGVHPGGADAWAQQEYFAAGMSVGAPPDAFSVQGQDWGLPPWRPDRLAASGYAPYRRLLRALFRYAGALRIDHVMGLFRLWWIPQGRPATEGTYVRYDAEAMLAILALEAYRAGALVIGEDLGTVEPGVREKLHEHGVLGTSVLWFERDWDGTGLPLSPESWRADCLATATTHDLPPTASRLTGDHVELRDRLGLLTRPVEEERAEAAADVGEWLALLARLGLLQGAAGGLSEDSEEAQIQALHRFLLRTPARMIGVWLPDAIGDRRPQNLPGTWDQYPNWRLPVADAEGRPVTLEELAASPRLHALIDVVRAGRAVGGCGSDAGVSVPEPAESGTDLAESGPGSGGVPPRTAPPGARPD